ncbi:hypothetical protein [Solwaraspora sp. WMMD792]|uniref:hypothetical protein n=1 Tax=unclassified Solwaraspora TaxID=2627926 RepID=UPI002415B550|nr:hypothetical protein [Solwaraspora sp. WMMD792]MDG4772432.1 hypothetical protein [Solwaraspora sp. WMMD792]
MNDTIRTVASSTGSPQVRLSLSRLAAAEWTKLRTLRSVAVAALCAVGLGLAGGLLQLLSYGPASEIGSLNATRALTDSMGMARAGLQIGVVVLAVLAVGSEYATGAIRTTLIAAPRRLAVMAAKAAVVAVAAALLAAIVLTIVFMAAVPLLRGVGFSAIPFGPGVAVLGTEVGYCVIVALFAFAVTLAFRSTALGVSLALGVVLLLPIMLALLNAMLQIDLTGLAFPQAVSGVMTDPVSTDLPVVLAWLGVPAVFGGAALVRRDA